MSKKSKFILKMIFSAICGGIIGFSVSYFTNHQHIGLDLTKLYEPAYYIGSIIQVLFLAAAFIMYFKARSIVRQYPSDDEKIDVADKLVDYGCVAATISTIVSFSYISLVSAIDGSVMLLVVTLVFAVSMILSIVVSSLLFGLIKKINPEKDVSFYEKNADKELLKRMDEREKQVMGVAASSTLIFMKKVFSFVMVATLLLGFLFKELVVVNFFLGIVWLVQTVVYSYKANKLERGNKDE